MLKRLSSTEPIVNFFNTCALDSIIRSILNSDTICAYLLNYMDEHYTSNPKTLLGRLVNENKKKIKIGAKHYDNTGFFDYFQSTDQYTPLVASYVILYYHNDEKKDMIMNRLRLHISFLEHRDIFSEFYTETEDEDFDNRSLNAQYLIYTNYLTLLAEENQYIFNVYTFMNTFIIDKIYQCVKKYKVLDALNYTSRKSQIMKHLEGDDLYFRYETAYPTLDIRQMNITNVNALYRCAITLFDDYICTDMILRVVSPSSITGTHFVFYNVLENYMQDDEAVSYVPIRKLYITNPKIEITYLPEVLHFQRIHGIKVLATKAGFTIDANVDDLLHLETKSRIINRLKLIQACIVKSHAHQLLVPEHDKYISDLKQVEEIYNTESPTVEQLMSFKFNMLEKDLDGRLHNDFLS